MSSSEKLKNITQLLKESWQMYCRKIKTLLGIVVLPVGFSFLFWILICFLSDTSLRYSVWFSVIEAISYLGSFVLGLLVIPSLLYNFKENTGVGESYKRGLTVLSSYIWVSFLLAIIIGGGFCLFIIPGILFSIWFSLAVFVLVFEEQKGLNALLRSKYLVKGKFWGVLLRFLVIGLIYVLGLFLVVTLIGFCIKNSQIANQISRVISYFVQLFVLPFSLIYGYLIYNNLNEITSGIPDEKSYQMRKIKYLMPGILGVLIIGLLVSILFFYIFCGRDKPPIDDSELWLSKIEIPKEENAFYYLNQASQKLYLPEDKTDLFREMVKGKEWDSELARELVEKNNTVLDYFEKALDCPSFQIPQLQDPKTVRFDIFIPGMSDFRNMAILNSINAGYLFTLGREKEAFDLAIKIIKMGQIIQDSPRPDLIYYLVGLAIKEIGLQRLRLMIPKTILSSEVLIAYMRELEQFKENEEGLIKAAKMEYIRLINTTLWIEESFIGKRFKEEVERAGLKEILSQARLTTTTPLNYFYKRNQTQRMFAEDYRNVINNVNKNYNEMQFPEIKPLAPSSTIKMLFTENIVGKILHDILVLNFSAIFNNKCLEDFSVIGTQSVIAIRAFQIETGKIPVSLEELVPKYFSELPRDPFDGKPIKYSPEKKILYSVGKDLKDSGGSEGESLRTMEDPTFTVEF